MAVRAGLRHASGTDQGRRRTNNEDRIYVDAERGIFAVVDGVGGQAAGELAADTAVEVIRERLERQTGTPEVRLREAIALANNEINRLAHTNPEWAGMACVLTVALIEDETVAVGHVGDSRLYLLQPGRITKMTHDHSPVGEREDHGELSEVEAMRHARRNEIYRDVGSGDRAPDDPAFVEISSFPMPSDGALLLCSDGLTDLITSEEIRAGVERYAPDYDAAILALIDAANHAGGKDNITVVIVAAPGYNPKPTGVPFRPRAEAQGRRLPYVIAALLIGVALGVGGSLLWKRFTATPFTGINAALAAAHPGETVLVPQGEYQEQVRLKQGVTLAAQQGGTVTIKPPGKGPAIIAEKIQSGAIDGLWVLGGGIEIDDATIRISNVYVTGSPTGIEIRGHSEPIITASQIINNQTAGIEIAGGASPKLERNLIAGNGKAGIQIDAASHPLLRDNAVVNNATAFNPGDYPDNFFGGVPEEAPGAASRPATTGHTATGRVLPPSRGPK